MIGWIKKKKAEKTDKLSAVTAFFYHNYPDKIVSQVGDVHELRFCSHCFVNVSGKFVSNTDFGRMKLAEHLLKKQNENFLNEKGYHTFTVTYAECPDCKHMFWSSNLKPPRHDYY